MKTGLIKYDHEIYGLDQGMVRAFLIVGDKRALLFDAGVEYDDGFMELIRSITGLPVELCLSHSDHDHTANAAYFHKLYLHKNEAARFSELSDGSHELIELEDGHIFDLGNRKLKVIHCPGHTPGSIALLDADNRLLFSGDTVSYGPVYMFGEGRDDEAYLQSLRMLDKLYREGLFSSIYPCHNSCPIDCGPISELTECINGIMSRKLNGNETPMTDASGHRVQVFKVGKSGIYHV